MRTVLLVASASLCTGHDLSLTPVEGECFQLHCSFLPGSPLTREDTPSQRGPCFVITEQGFPCTSLRLGLVPAGGRVPFRWAVTGQDPQPRLRGLLAWGEEQMTIGDSWRSLTLSLQWPSLSFSAGRGAAGGHVHDWLGLCLCSAPWGETGHVCVMLSGSYTPAAAARVLPVS